MPGGERSWAVTRPSPSHHLVRVCLTCKAPSGALSALQAPRLRCAVPRRPGGGTAGSGCWVADPRLCHRPAPGKKGADSGRQRGLGPAPEEPRGTQQAPQDSETSDTRTDVLPAAPSRPSFPRAPSGRAWLSRPGSGRPRRPVPWRGAAPPPRRRGLPLHGPGSTVSGDRGRAGRAGSGPGPATRGPGEDTVAVAVAGASGTR